MLRGLRSRSSRFARPAPVLLLTAVLLPLACPSAPALEGPDTLGVRFEVGGSTDLTNEQFYEDAFVDTVSLGRNLVDSPEARVAGVLYASVMGTRGQRAAQFRIENELSLGDKIQRDLLGASWRQDLSPDWRIQVSSQTEYRRDRTFDRDLDEWRGFASARLRRSFADAATFADLGLSGDLLRSSGEGALFLLDRNSGRVSVGFERFPLFGPEWRLGYSLEARVFPDSSERDHFEHGWEGRLRTHVGSAALTFETDGARRVTFDSAPTSRDNLWDAQGLVEADVRWTSAFWLRTRVGIEALRYDRQDTTLFFNYEILRAQVVPRTQRGPWNLGVGPGAEALISRGDPSEEYRQIGGIVEIEYLGGGAWWSVAPAVGWRDYRDGRTADPGAPSLHSSYGFYELSVLGDQPLPGSMRFRLLATARLESHVDSTQDARSLYFSLDVRRLF